MEDPPRLISRIRLTAGVAFVLSAAAFVLTLLAVLSGASPGMLADSDLLTVCTLLSSLDANHAHRTTC